MGFVIGVGCSSETDAVRPPGNAGSGGGGGDTTATGSSGAPAGTGAGGASTGVGGTSAGTGGDGAGGATDGGGGASPIGDAGGPNLAKWQYFKAITLDTTANGANVSAAVPKYPVPIVLTQANFDFTQAKDQGADLRLSTVDGALLPYAIESWDSAAKVAALWVKVDVKGNDNSQSVLLNWGNAEAVDASDSHSVFDVKDGFVGVWHLGEPGSTTAGGYKDATANAADATGINVDAAATIEGRIGKAASLTHSKLQWIRLDGDKNALFDIYNQMTYSIWIYAKSHTVEYQAAFTKGETGFRMHYYGMPSWTENRGKNIVEICVESAGGGDICPLKGGNANAWQGTDVAPGKWFHWVAIHNNPNLTFYLNSVLEVSANEGGTWTSGAAKPVAIGNNSNSTTGARSWDGYLDEARVMKVVKDVNWVKLEYESQREGQKLVTLGSTQRRF
ncbi:MAG TPA: DUF2341 domain-containing protein [Polyangiaceae bacterium]